MKCLKMGGGSGRGGDSPAGLKEQLHVAGPVAGKGEQQPGAEKVLGGSLQTCGSSILQHQNWFCQQRET